MIGLKAQMRATIALGVMSLLAVVVAHLALTDIYHGEPDVTLEWSVVRFSLLVLLLFVGMALHTLRRALRKM